MVYICVLVLFVFFAGVAMTVQEGLWNNMINLMAVMTCSVLAAVVGPPLGVLALDKAGKDPSSMWFFTFAATWLVFFAAIMIFRILLERTSRVRMLFVPPLEMAAGPLVGLFTAIMFTSFFAFTLYTMPVRAGEWQLPPDGWQRTTMKSGSGPFWTLLKSTIGEDDAMARFFKN